MQEGCDTPYGKNACIDNLPSDMSCSAVGCEFTVTELAKMFFLLFFLGGACCKACGILVP